MSGNQYHGRKARIMRCLGIARTWLGDARYARENGLAQSEERSVRYAASFLAQARMMIDAAPASTRRRWACGR